MSTLTPEEVTLGSRSLRSARTNAASPRYASVLPPPVGKKRRSSTSRSASVGFAMPRRFIRTNASWKGRHVGGLTLSGLQPRICAVRCLAALAMVRFAMRNASSTSGSASSSIPIAMRWRASSQRSSRSLATSARRLSVGAAVRWAAIQEPYSVANALSAVRAWPRLSTPARFSIDSSTPTMVVGSTFSTSAVGIQALRTSPQWPAASMFACVDTPCPTENSNASRYWRSAMRSSASSSMSPRRLGRATKPSASDSRSSA
jgi:hypothetical protein